jgi:protein-tyrosine phosphatase
VIDLHSHILPGLDDGAATLEESLQIARAAVVDGIDTIAATPHVRDDYPTSAAEMEERVAEVREACVAAGIPLDVRPGGELALDRLVRLSSDDLRRFGLGGNPRCVLLEFPYYGWPLDLGDRLFRLRTEGLSAVLAHPERNADVQADPERLGGLVRGGALVQVTAAALDGRLGRRVRETATALVELELAHLVASDAHAPSVRAIGMRGAADAIGDEALADWLTRAVPAALLAGEALPERPEVEARPRVRWFRRRP